MCDNVLSLSCELPGLCDVVVTEWGFVSRSCDSLCWPYNPSEISPRTTHQFPIKLNSEQMSVTVSILGKDQIVIGYDIVQQIVEDTLSKVSSSTYVLVTDTNISRHDHYVGLVDSFKKKLGSNQRLLECHIPPGELYKTRLTKARVEDFMFSKKCTREAVILAVGGGVIGDMIGYVAASFMRGIRFVQIPTTLLAMVDSSIGGKTAIDTPAGKNLVGAFWQPALNFIDLRFLESLPTREFLNGMSEVIKTAAIWDAPEFSRLERVAPEFMAGLAAPRDSKGRVNLEPIKQILLDSVVGSVRVKAEVVTLDEREGGLRNILNFGHSIGHAYEALLTPHILHGECVSIGCVLEAELSRYLGTLSPTSVARLVSIFKAYDLPVTVSDPVVRSRSRNVALPVDKVLSIMAVDKKNDGAKKKVTLLSSIGKTYEPKATTVSDEDIRVVLSADIGVHPITSSPADYIIIPPGSKSISNRVLVLCALGEGTCRVSNLLHSDDTGYMLDALQDLGAAKVETEDNGETLVVTGTGGKGLLASGEELYLGNAGTAARFLTAVASLVPGKVHLTGNQRMQQRPIGALVDALRSNGTNVTYSKSQGSLPLTVHGGHFRGGEIELAATVSSQYVSALLMVAPYADEPVTLKLVGGKPISQFYIDMTIKMMADFGVTVVKDKVQEHTYKIPKGSYKCPVEYTVESDASSATYPLAFAALTGTKCTVPTIGSSSLQGDARFATDVLRPMGCTVYQSANSTTVQGPTDHKLVAIDVDMEPMTDAFLTACVVAAVASGTTRITGIANQHVKECDRINAMYSQLAKFGVSTMEGEDGIDVMGVSRSQLKIPTEALHSYDDHRVAMSLSLLSTLVDGLTTIDDRRCVEKTWPGWWDTLHTKLGVKLEGVTLESHIENPVIDAKEQTVVLVGMRGAGKTLLGKAAAAALGYAFADIDQELEAELDTTIPEIIRTKGWEAFRVAELDVFQRFLAQHQSRFVIACGGGIVETAQAREILKRYSEKGLVVHVHRNLKDIIALLNEDKTRPSFVDDLEAVYKRREPLYEEVSNRLYFQAPVSDHSVLQKSLRNFFSSEVPLDTSQRTFFLSLTLPNLQHTDIDLEAILEGCNAVELRVDLLESWDTEFVSEQIGYLRLNTDLPIIFTVRSKSQGGSFPDDDSQGYRALLELAFKSGVEYVDVELTQPGVHQFVQSKRGGRTFVIASHHDPKRAWSWDSIEWRSAFFKANRLGDVVKFVATADTFEDNFKLEDFRKEIAPSKAPFIGINMGYAGQLSRILNRVMTPVTHPLLPSAAAPGQLSVKQCNETLSVMGGIPTRQFFVTGEPISHSQSPNLHNSSYEALGLSHHFSKFETSDANAVKAEISRLGNSWGGSAVTIPLKEDIIQLCAELSEDAQIIGAVNTLSPVGNGLIKGSNTDWIAIKHSFEKLGTVTGDTALIVGAGGTAMAATFAFYKMGFRQVYVLNRTLERAERLSKHFEGLIQVTTVSDANASKVVPQAILNCIPGDRDIPDEMLARIKTILSATQGSLLDAAYKPDVTPMMKLARSYGWETIAGRQMLVFGGVEQFYMWTGFYPITTATRALLEK